MAGCRFFVLPLEPGLNRCDQTILNTHVFRQDRRRHGLDRRRTYLRHGVNGFVVPERSVAGWVDTPNRVARVGDEARDTIARQASYDARVCFSEDARLLRVLESALDVVGDGAGANIRLER